VRCSSSPRKVLRGGISKVNFQETSSIFGDKCPQNCSKNDPMAPRTTLECSHEGPRVVKGARARAAPLPSRSCALPRSPPGGREIGNLLPNNRRQRRTYYALCHILYPVSAAHTSIFRMDSNSTSYAPRGKKRPRPQNRKAVKHDRYAPGGKVRGDVRTLQGLLESKDTHRS